MNVRRHIYSQSSFTLVELLIVIGILAVLTSVVVLVIKPDQVFKQARDTKRMSELQDIDKAIAMFQSLGGTSLGTATNIYISLPGTDGDNDCDEYVLPALPAGYSYYCSVTANYRNIDGTGWIPVNLSTSAGALFHILPIDPVNTVANGYYTYVMGGSWELTAKMESNKYSSIDGGASMLDGGSSLASFEVGTNLKLTPTAVEEFKRDSSLVGYWTFEEGSGSTAYDASGNSINGTWSGPSYSTGKVGTYSGNFTGGGNNVDLGTSSSLAFNNKMTISAWIKNSSASGVLHVVGQMATYTPPASTGYHMRLFDMRYWGGVEGDLKFGIEAGGNSFWTNSPATSVPVINDGVWHLAVIVITTSNIKFYQDGNYVGTVAGPISINDGGTHYSIGVELPGGGEAYTGLLDDVRIYNRDLSATEILALYNATK
ncbi:MAG: prepilin-type N-terminal cleavage/methylation domain-containing protein [Candidatus Pacebacteria bacterium]|nr:prepilin-type N-terminal cleavage/methylation domain-containing protein [Candidatus Paceibacterota bacterium]